jgi:hypothetical protein
MHDLTYIYDYRINYKKIQYYYTQKNNIRSKHINLIRFKIIEFCEQVKYSETRFQTSNNNLDWVWKIIIKYRFVDDFPDPQLQ